MDQVEVEKLKSMLVDTKRDISINSTEMKILTKAVRGMWSKFDRNQLSPKLLELFERRPITRNQFKDKISTAHTKQSLLKAKIASLHTREARIKGSLKSGELHPSLIALMRPAQQWACSTYKPNQQLIDDTKLINYQFTVEFNKLLDA